MNAENEDPLTLEEMVSQNRKFTLETPKIIDTDIPDREETFTDDEPGIFTTDQGQSYVTQWNITRKYYSAINNPDEFVLYNANASVLWPGNLIQGQSMISGSLDPIPVSSRKPLTVYCTTLSGTQTAEPISLENPSGSSVTQAMNEIVENFYGTSHSASYIKQEIFSSEHLKFNLDAAFSNATTSLDSSLGIDWSEEKQRVMIKLTQQYFTMAIDNPPGWSGFLGDEVTASDLKPYTSASNPMVYLDSVTYGRTFVLVYESANSSFDLNTQLGIAYNGLVASGSVDAENAYQDVMANSEVRCFAMGGNATEALSAARDFDLLSDYITNGAVLSAESIGVPISYTLRYLKDASLVKMNNTLEYYVDEKTPIQSSAMESEFHILFDQMQLSAYDSGADPTLQQIKISIELYNADTESTVDITEGGYSVVDYKSITDTETLSYSLNKGYTFRVPKNINNRLRIYITGYESDGNGNTYFQSHSTSAQPNFLDITYNAGQNRWENQDKAAPQISARAMDPNDGGEWLQGNLTYSLTVQDYIPE